MYPGNGIEPGLNTYNEIYYNFLNFYPWQTNLMSIQLRHTLFSKDERHFTGSRSTNDRTVGN
jgi:hypothetical protein